MMLEGKTALIHGGSGSIGGAVAHALAMAGAQVCLTGRTSATLEAKAAEIRKAGGKADIFVLDVLDEGLVAECVERMVERNGSLDISFCAIDHQPTQNMPLTGMKLEDFVRPVEHAMRAHFITAIAAASVMKAQGSGVILTLTATPGGIGYPYTGGFAPACAAIESFMRNLASEIGPQGVRVVNMRSAGTLDSRVFKQAIEQHPDIMAPIQQAMTNDTMLKRMPLMQEVANAAVFLCSPMASAITGVTVDLTAGTTAGFNYKVTG